MKNKIVALLGVLLICCVSCHKKKETPSGCIEYQGEYYQKVDPIKYDSNKDGVIDASDAKIEMLGDNMKVTKNPDGSALYSNSEEGGESGEGGSGTGGGGSQSGSAVALGKRYCYKNVEKYCDKNGGLYAFETSVNTSHSSLASIYNDADVNNNNVADYIENLRSESSIENFAFLNSSKYATEIAKKIEKLAMKQIGTNFLFNSMKDAISNALKEVLYESNEYINVTNVETIINARVSVAIVDAVNEAGILSSIDDQEALASLASTYAATIAKETADAIAAETTKAILSQYEKQMASGAIQNVQGICPKGYHIPSDFEWMIFESAIGMSDADLAKGGETEITRGADAKVVEKMVNEMGFDFGGYASINGTFAQYGEAGVYWSSTTGTDEKGDYVWVRQIDTSYTGVVRFKMYEKSGLSVRCFKD